MNTFESIRSEHLKVLNQRLSEAKISIANLIQSDKTSGLSATGYEPILKEEPVCPVPKNTAINILLDLRASEGATDLQSKYCEFLLLTMPGKNFVNASWLATELTSMATPPDDFVMPERWETLDLAAFTGVHIDVNEYSFTVAGDDDGFDGGSGNGGPLVPSSPEDPRVPDGSMGA